MMLTTTADNTVVIKQIMIDEPIAEVTLPASTTGVENTAANAKAIKRIENGQVVIINNGRSINVLGQSIR